MKNLLRFSTLALCATLALTGCEKAEVTKSTTISAAPDSKDVSYFLVLIKNTDDELAAGFAPGSELKWQVQYPCTGGVPNHIRYYNVYVERKNRLDCTVTRYLLESNAATTMGQCIFNHTTIVPATPPPGNWYGVLSTAGNPNYEYSLILQDVANPNLTGDSEDSSFRKHLIFTNARRERGCE